jgi:hypothetical protein
MAVVQHSAVSMEAARREMVDEAEDASMVEVGGTSCDWVIFSLSLSHSLSLSLSHSLSLRVSSRGIAGTLVMDV